MADKAVQTAPEETSAVYSFYGRQDALTNVFAQYPENEVAHAVGLSGSDKGKTFYVDSNGKIAKLAPGGDEDVIGFLNGVPTTVAGASAALEVTKEFVATGSISDGAFVALRSDGTVEAVTGTETLASIGSDATITAVTSMRFLDGEYNATSGKLVCLFYDVGASNTMYLVIGTVSGNTITFGSPQTFTGGTGATYWTDGRIAWNSAGSQVFAAFQGATGYQSFVSATVSGTTMTFGSVVQNGTVAWGSAATDRFFAHDNTNSKLVYHDDSTGNLVAATYSGTTITLGTSATFACTGDQNPRYFYDESNQRFTVVGTNTNTYVRSATLSGTTWTVGTEVSTSTLLNAFAALETSSGKIVLFGTRSPSSNRGLPYATVITFSGANATINTETKVANYSITDIGVLATRSSYGAYEATSGKVCFAVKVSDATVTGGQNDLMMFVGTISGASVSFVEPVAIGTNITLADSVLARGSNSELAVIVTDASDYNRYHVITGKISSGVFVVKDDTLMRSTPVTAPPPTAGTGSNIRRKNLMASWGIINLNQWGLSGTSDAATIFMVTLPTESTNADDWIGVAREAATNGNSLSVRLAGGIDDERSGLTPETDYYLKGDGTLITTDNGRYAGRALSATSMLLRAL